jgi:hypothetical protein
MFLKGLSQMFHILLIIGIQVLCTEIDLRMDAVLENKIDPLKEHGVRNVRVNDSHG